MKFAIRDDDVSFFTKETELMMAYGRCFSNSIPISFSVIPDAVNHHGEIWPYGTGPFDREYGKVGDNQEIVQFLRKKMEMGQAEVLMHGIHHEYYKEKGTWIPEMCKLSKAEIYEELPKQRQYLSGVFSCPINVFAAPSNSMNKETFRCLEKLGMNTMCTLSKHFDHPFSARYFYYYVRRNICKMFGVNDVLGILQYKNYREIPIYGLNSFEIMKRYYFQCKKNDIPFIIYTHYWELNASKEEAKKLENIIDFMVKDGAYPELVSKCFNS